MSGSECHRRIVPGRLAIAAASVMIWLAAAGCSVLQKKQVHQMGEKVQVGGIVYNVLEAEWATELTVGGSTRTPQHRFLVVRLTMNNSSNREASIPLLNLETDKGQTYLELADSQGLDEWLGVLRTLGPTETQTGKIVFDVPQGGYSLRLTDGGEPDRERFAFVSIPVKLQESVGIDAPPAPEGKQD